MSWLVIYAFVLLGYAKNGCLRRNDLSSPQNQTMPTSKHDDRCFLIDATLLKEKDISKT